MCHPMAAMRCQRKSTRLIDATLKSISPIRAVANVVRVGSAGYRKLVTTQWCRLWLGFGSCGTANHGHPPRSTKSCPRFGELYANPAATQAMLDDAQFDVEAWLADEISSQFAKSEGTAFVNGDGVDKPKGFLTYTTAATNDTHALSASCNMSRRELLLHYPRPIRKISCSIWFMLCARPIARGLCG